MARLLVLDTALARCAVGVSVDGDMAAEVSEAMNRGHAERLMPMIDEALASAAVRFEDLDLVAVAAGPGSFTGIRIGIAAARGMALALRIPAVGVGVLEALAEEASGGFRGKIAAVNRGPRETVYRQSFEVGDDGGFHAVAEPEWVDAVSLGPEEMSPECLCVGSAAAWMRERFGVLAMEREYPDLSAVARVAIRRGADGVPRPSPVYVRPPDARPRAGP